MRRLFGCPDIVSLTEKFLMARNFYRIFTENNPVMGDSKTFGIPEAKGLKKRGFPRHFSEQRQNSVYKLFMPFMLNNAHERWSLGQNINCAAEHISLNRPHCKVKSCRPCTIDVHIISKAQQSIQLFNEWINTAQNTKYNIHKRIIQYQLIVKT